MLRKLFLGLLFTCCTLFLLVVGGLVLTYVLVTSVPQDYTAALEINEADEQKRQLEHTLTRLAGVGLDAEQRARLRFNAPQSKPFTDQEWTEVLDELDRGEKRTTQIIRQDELNAWIAEEMPSGGEGLIDPRIILQDGQLLLASRLSNEGFSVVMTAELTPHITADQLVLEINHVRIGRVPLPIDLIAKFLAEQNAGRPQPVTLDATSSPPRLCIDWDQDLKIRLVDATISDHQIEVTVEAADASDATIRPVSLSPAK